MNIKITSTHIDASPSVNDYVTKKMTLLEKFIGHGSEALCEVELSKTTEHHKSGDIYKAEVNITYMGKQYYVFAEKDDLYAAIDEMRDEAERVIVSGKKKYSSMLRRGSKKIKDLIKGLYK